MEFFPFISQARVHGVYPLPPTGMPADRAPHVYMFKYDSVHGPFQSTVEAKDGKLYVNGNAITVFGERDPSAIKWGSVGAHFFFTLGRMGIIDHDIAEVWNAQDRIGCASHQTVIQVPIFLTCRLQHLILACRLDSRLKVDATSEALSPSNAVRLLQNYDVIRQRTHAIPPLRLPRPTARQLCGAEVRRTAVHI